MKAVKLTSCWVKVRLGSLLPKTWRVCQTAPDALSCASVYRWCGYLIRKKKVRKLPNILAIGPVPMTVDSDIHADRTPGRVKRWLLGTGRAPKVRLELEAPHA